MRTKKQRRLRKKVDRMLRKQLKSFFKQAQRPKYYAQNDRHRQIGKAIRAEEKKEIKKWYIFKQQRKIDIG